VDAATAPIRPSRRLRHGQGQNAWGLRSRVLPFRGPMKKTLLSFLMLGLTVLAPRPVHAFATTASGTPPAALPSRLLVGLFEDSGQTWMRDSAVPWDVRYRYFVKGWINNWGWSPADGSWGLQFMRESDAQGFLPAIQYYQMNFEPGGGEAQFLDKVRNASTMRGYFSDFKVLMQRAREFGKPVLVLVEADGFAYLQKQTSSNPYASAAVASTGLPELAGLPNTVAGWGLAFLQLRKAVGANNVILGMHVSAWAGDGDLAHFSVTSSLVSEVTKVHAFLKPLGLAPNVTGATWDVLVADPLDRDAQFYQVTRGENRWWDPSDSASILSRSFNRYAEWLRLWNVASGKRWVLWQVPLGNSSHLNVANTRNAPREGYADNRAEYFFGTGNSAHLQKFANSGVIALLFGRGESQQSSHTNDYYSDGQLFMKSRAGAFLKAGGLPLTSGTGTGGTTLPPPPPVSTDSAPYNFESGTQGWMSWGPMITSVSSSTARAWAGSRSLEVKLAAVTNGTARLYVSGPAVAGGRTVSFRIWLPVGARISAFQPYVQQGSSGYWKWTGAWIPATSLTPGAWNTLNVPVPAGAVSPLHELGVELFTDATWAGTIQVDSVSW
jgi:hypothetical protein